MELAVQYQQWQFYVIYEMGDCFDPARFYAGLRSYPELRDNLMIKMMPLPVAIGQKRVTGADQRKPSLLATLPDSFTEYAQSTSSVDFEQLRWGWSGDYAQRLHSYRIIVTKHYWAKMADYLSKARLEEMTRLFVVSSTAAMAAGHRTLDWITQVAETDIAQQTTRILSDCIRLFSVKLQMEIDLHEEEQSDSDPETAQSDASAAVKKSAQEDSVSLDSDATIKSSQGQERAEPPKWKERDWQEGDRQAEKKQTSLGWSAVGASRIGKLHIQHDGVREDAFAIEVVGGWSLVAVADGGGSYRYAARGAQLATETAVRSMVESCHIKGAPLVGNPAHVKEMMQLAIRSAWTAIDDEARRRRLEYNESISRRDFSTTLLLLAHHPEGYVGIAQIGDGLIAAQMVDDSLAALGRPESGEYASETSFLPRSELGQILDTNIQISRPKASVRAIFVMTDGVSDDFHPFEKRLPSLADEVYLRLHDAQAEQELLSLLDYEMRGSFDDRTLVVLFDNKNLESEADLYTRIDQRKAELRNAKDHEDRAPEKLDDSRGGHNPSGFGAETIVSDEEVASQGNGDILA